MTIRFVLMVVLMGCGRMVCPAPAHAAAPPSHTRTTHLAAPLPHPVGGIGPGTIGGAATPHGGIIAGKPIFRHHP